RRRCQPPRNPSRSTCGARSSKGRMDRLLRHFARIYDALAIRDRGSDGSASEARTASMRRRRVGALERIRGSVIPLATTAELGPAVRRTLLLRILFGAALIGLAVAATETGRSNAA